MQRRNALFLKPSIAVFVSSGPSPHVMRHAIDLNGKHRLRAEKIEYEISGGVLPPKLEAAGALAEPAPKDDFGPAHRAA
jgi:hypothetical protein